MDKKKVEELLIQNEINDIEEIQYKEGIAVYRFYYDFDESELEAAKAYANDESDEDEETEEWYEEFFFPYLSDLAVDNVGEIIEEIMESNNVAAQYMSYDLDEENYDSCEFIAVFSKETDEIQIEDVLDDLKL